MLSRFSGPARHWRTLGFALAAAPLLALASSTLVALDSHSPSKSEAPATAAEALEHGLAALAEQDSERLAARLVKEQREQITGRYGTALVESLIVHEWLEPRILIDGTAARATVRWKARFQQQSFVQALAGVGPQAKNDASAEEWITLGRELAVRLEPQRQTFRLVRASEGWLVALPETWLGLIESFEHPEAHAEGESARDAAVAILEAYRHGDAAALAERSLPSEQDGFAQIARALLDAVEVRTYEVIAAAEGPRRAKVTYRWVTKLNLPAFVRSVESSLPQDDSEETQGVRSVFREMAREHGAAYLDARQRPRQSMLLKKVDGRWYLERIMAETVTNSLTPEGGTTPEHAAEQTADAMVKAHHEQMMNLFVPQARGRYWEQFQPILEALVIDGYEVYRIDELDGDSDSLVARVVWNAHFDTEAFVLVVKDIMREQLTAQGVPAERIESQVEFHGNQAEMRAQELNAILSMPRAAVVLRKVNDRWYLHQLAGEPAPPEDEVSMPTVPWPTH